MEEITTALLRQALESTQDGLTIAEVRGNDHPLIYVNSAFERLTGYTRGEVIGRDCRFLQGPETDRRAIALLKAALLEGKPAYVTLLNYRKDGSAFWNELSVSPIRGAAGKITHFIGIQKDITEQMELQRRLEEKNRTIEKLLQQLAFQNKRDPLTGVHNRRGLEEEGRLLLESAKRGGGHLSVLFIDIDHFKTINDHYGHDIGDKCLRRLAVILQNRCNRASDLILRYGGEEFVVISPALGDAATRHLAECIRGDVETETIRLPDSANALKFTVSIGFTCRVPAPNDTLADMIHEADVALYEAKRKGRNLVMMFQ